MMGVKMFIKSLKYISLVINLTQVISEWPPSLGFVKYKSTILENVF